jgi:hypothetical protein
MNRIKTVLMKITILIVSLFFVVNIVHSQKLVEEDFTTGAFDGFGSGLNGSNWNFSGPGTAFRAPNNRPFALGLSNRIQAGGGGWADGAQWRSWNGTEQEYFKIHKYNDMVICRFTSFSDYAHKNNLAGVEVAFLEERSSMCGDPHYCHDLSFEVMNCYYTSPGKGGSSNQMETNVENTDNPAPLGVQYAHKNGWYAKTDLDVTQTGLVVWRNEPMFRKCNIEQWGNVNWADFYVDTPFVSLLDPTNEYAFFSVVQITFFRGIAIEPTTQFIKRDGILYDNLQIGIKDLHIGITKRADFNLDYVVNDADVDTLVKYSGSSSAHIRIGDADNNQVVDARDGNALIGLWTGSAAGANVNSYYNSSNGNITLDLTGVSFIMLKGPANSFNGATPDLSSLPHDAYLKTDSSIVLFTRGVWNQNGINLGNVAATGLSVDNLTLTFNYKSSQLGLGTTVNVGESFNVGLINNQQALASVWIDGLHFDVSGASSKLLCQVYNVNGVKLFEQRIKTGEQLTLPELSAPLRIIRLVDALNGNAVAVKKVYDLKK